MLDTQELIQRRGNKLLDEQGNKIGQVDELYLDDATGEPEWALVDTGLFDLKRHFAPLREAQTRGEDLVVPYGQDTVKDAPQFEADGGLTPEQEVELYDYYGIDYTQGSGQQQQTGKKTGGPGHDTSAANTDDAMTRSEEQVHVGTQREEAGRVRLHKYVVTDEVQQTVPVKREEVRVEREPITDANRDEARSGPAFNDDEEHEVTLHEERPVVSKEEVPKERVRLTKDEVDDEAQVSDQVRREEIEVEDDAKR